MFHCLTNVLQHGLGATAAADTVPRCQENTWRPASTLNGLECVSDWPACWLLIQSIAATTVVSQLASFPPLFHLLFLAFVATKAHLLSRYFNYLFAGIVLFFTNSKEGGRLRCGCDWPLLSHSLLVSEDTTERGCSGPEPATMERCAKPSHHQSRPRL